MTISILTPELVDGLRAFFVAQNEPNYAWGNVGSMLLSPALRGLWLYGSVDENGNALDNSGQGRTLTNVSSLQYGVYNGLVPYAIHDGSADYLTRATEAGLEITGALTFGCWVRVNDITGGTYSIIGKNNTTGNQKSFIINRGTPPFNLFAFGVSSTGANGFDVNSTVIPADDVWFHVVGRYTPSTELAIFVNGVKTTNTTSIPASIFNSSSAFRVGANGAGTEVLDGDTALPFLCAGALSDTLIQYILWHGQRALFGRAG